LRRLLATMITVATVSAGVAATFGGTVQAAPVVTHLEGDDAAPRFAVDVSDDGRYVLTRSLVGQDARVIDRQTGVVTPLPEVASGAVAISGDGLVVTFATTQSLVETDIDTLSDAYNLAWQTGHVRVMSLYQTGAEFVPVDLDYWGYRATIQRQASGTGLITDRAFLSDGLVMEELATSLPYSTIAGSVSSTGRYVIVAAEQCPDGWAGSTCAGPRVLFRVDRQNGSVTPAGRAGDGSAAIPFLHTLSADGTCLAYTTLSPRAVWKDCGLTPGSPQQLSSGWEYTFPAANLSISPDGQTVGWIQMTTSRWTTPGTVQAPHVHVRTAASPTVVLDAPDGQLPYGSASGVLVVGPDHAVMNLGLTDLVPGATSGVFAREDLASAPTSTVGTVPPITGDTTVPPEPELPDDGAAVFTPRTPLRILDTRSGIGGPAGMRAGGMEIDLPIAGRYGVPPGATAVAVQVTATEGTAAGYVSVLPGLGRAGLTSNLNVDPHETIANSAVVPLGPDGSIRVYLSSPTHLVLDLAGWWTPVGAAVSAGRFQAAGPVRVLDTRPETAVGSAGVKPAAGATTTIQVTGRSGIPATGVSAVVVNVTIADPAALGFVQVAPAATLVPGASSTLNVGAPGQVIAASAIVPVDAQGRIAIYNQPSTHLVVDVAGWFTDATAEPGLDGMFVAADTVTRVVDTRGANGDQPRLAAGSRIDLWAIGGAVVGNVTVTDTAGPGFVQLGPDDTMVNGATSNINPTRAGETVANAFIVPTGSTGIGLFTSNATHVVIDVAGYMTL
jgi:hypothetical protein